MAWGQSGNQGAELARLDLAEALGQEFVDLYSPLYPYDQRPTILTDDDLAANDWTGGSAPGVTARPAPEAVAALPVDYRGLDVPAGLAGGVPRISRRSSARAWAVIAGSSPDRTPPPAARCGQRSHLGIQMPSIWYEVGLHCRPVSEACPYDVVGFSLPGLPTILIGHNARIGWD
jgi:penicillin amidase